MNGWNRELTNDSRSEIMCSGKSEHFMPHMLHPSWFTQNNWIPVVTFGEQTLQHMRHNYVKFENKVYMTTIDFPVKNTGPCLNNFETRIDHLNRKICGIISKPVSHGVWWTVTISTKFYVDKTTWLYASPFKTRHCSDMFDKLSVCDSSIIPSKFVIAVSVLWRASLSPLST